MHEKYIPVKHIYRLFPGIPEKWSAITPRPAQTRLRSPRPGFARLRLGEPNSLTACRRSSLAPLLTCSLTNLLRCFTFPRVALTCFFTGHLTAPVPRAGGAAMVTTINPAFYFPLTPLILSPTKPVGHCTTTLSQIFLSVSPRLRGEYCKSAKRSQTPPKNAIMHCHGRRYK